MLFGSFLESFWTLLGALGPSLGDFWRTLAASGVAFETFVGFWACLVALGRICKVFGAFLKSFFTILRIFYDFLVFLVLIQPVLSNVGECSGLAGWEGVGEGGALHMLCTVSLLPSWFPHLLVFFFKLKRASRSHAKTGMYSGVF